MITHGFITGKRSVLFLFVVFMPGIMGRVWAADAKPAYNPMAMAPTSDEAEQIMKKFKLPPGMKCSLFAAEPMLAHPVALCTDEKGRIYVAETFRFADGISGGGDRDYGALDIRGHMDRVEEDLASRSIEDREALLHRIFGDKINRLTIATEQVRLLEDTTGSGRADKSTVFADGFNRIGDGAAAGVFARKGNVWFTCIPDLWLLRDTKGTGKADERKALLHGFGIRVAFLGHDLHGLCMGPDGKLYFTVGDRAFNVTTADGKNYVHPECGAVFRCRPDGTEFEVIATGLRNPECLAFDQYGNLFTADNNADHGDGSRWVYIVEGGDSGWRGGYQYITWPNPLGAWNFEKVWGEPFENQPAYIVPPVANIGTGPSGIKYYPGTGLSKEFDDHFFYSDFRGEGGGILSLAVKPKGAGFSAYDVKEFFWQVQATDLVFGVDGGAYVSVWYGGIQKTGKGRVYHIFNPELNQSSLVLETKKLLTEGFDQRSPSELALLLGHRDQRVRQEAQFALAEKGLDGSAAFVGVLAKKDALLPRIHAIWGLAQMKNYDALIPYLGDSEAEVRAQTAKVLSDGSVTKAGDGLIKLLKDPAPRPRFFAAIALGKFGRKDALDPVVEMLRADTSKDPYLRHAAVMALAGMNDNERVQKLASDPSPVVRMLILLVMRRTGSASIAGFLNDGEAPLVLEAARAINDVPIEAAMPALATMIRHPLPSGINAEHFMLRVVNANFRLGLPENAAALAEYAAREDANVKARILALRCLANWGKPGNLDLIVGLYRPLQARDQNVAASALRGTISTAILHAPADVRSAAFETIEKLQIKEAASALFEVISNKTLPGQVRASALKSLGAVNGEHLADAVVLAVVDKDENVRKEGNRLKAQLNPANAGSAFAEILEHGASVLERQDALVNLGICKDSKADEVLLRWMEKLQSGQAPKELQLELLEAAAKRSTPELKAAVEKYRSSEPKEDSLIGYRESLFGGDATLGRKIFFERVEASCTRCHRVDKQGGDAGPDLSDIGKRQGREYILESILAPNKQIAPGYESLIVKTKAGKIHVGILKHESETELELNCPPDIVKIPKAEVQTSKRGQSLMPEELSKVLNRRDLRNLVEFLAGLKGTAEPAGHGEQK